MKNYQLTTVEYGREVCVNEPRLRFEFCGKSLFLEAGDEGPVFLVDTSAELQIGPGYLGSEGGAILGCTFSELGGALSVASLGTGGESLVARWVAQLEK